MSTQLILYPQNYDGTYTDITNYNELVVDGSIFTSINASTSYTTALWQYNFLAANPPASVNTWYRYRVTLASMPALPIETGGNLILNSVAQTGTTLSISGVYQKLSNLTVGVSYTLRANVTTADGTVNLAIINGDTFAVIGSSFQQTNTSTSLSKTFTAQTTADIIWIVFLSSVAVDLTMYSISVLPTGETPTEIYSDLTDGQVICDLYEEEDIPLTLSVDEFKNVAEKVQSYSKAFKLPATKRNNLIFDSVFEITRTSTGLNFNPYVKTKCVLKQNGYILFDGFLRLIDIQDKEGEVSYSVNLYSEVVALADVLKDRTFVDLDFSELMHSYNKDNIIDSWYNSQGITLTIPLASTNSYAYSSAIGNLTNTNVLKYPFVDWTGQITLADGTGNATLDMPELATLEQAFRPFIQLKYIINKIFSNTQFTWSSDFFDSNFFEDLFMDFNWGAGNAPFDVSGSGSGERFGGANQPLFPSWNYIQFNVHTFSSGIGYSGGVFTAAGDNQTYTVQYSIPFVGNGDVYDRFSVEWVRTDSAGTIVELIDVVTMQSCPISFSYSGTFTRTIDTNETIYCRAFENGGSVWHEAMTVNPPQTTVTTSSTSFTSETLLDTLRGETNQWDFLKGILTMFNLVSMPDEETPNNIIIEPYSTVFIVNTFSGTTSDLSLASRSIQHDWTDKVDVSEMKLTPLTDLNKTTIFKYEEDDDDYAFNVYKNATSGFLYGSLKVDASNMYNGLQTVLSGTKEIVATPFAATIPKPLFNAPLDNFIVPSIYSGNEDGTTEEYENVPRVVQMTTVKVLDGGGTYFIPAQNLLTYENKDRFLQCSHLSDIPIVANTEDINFGVCQLINPLGAAPVDNLYSTYWEPYYDELYNADTRIMTLKVNLTPSDINLFKFTNKVFIKNRVFRVNKIDYKPNALATVEFILIP
jgi:hypothetical protein